MMPHHESSSGQLVVPKNAANEATAPSQDDVNSIIHTIFNTDKSQVSLDASYALTNLLATTVGHRGFSNDRVLETIRKASTNKKNAGAREGAMFALGALFERFPPQDPMSEVVFMVQNDTVVAMALDALADKVPATRESAKYALDALFGNLKSEALGFALLPCLVQY